MLRINEIGEGGLAEAWNAANPTTEILTCDRVAQVNGFGQIAEMQEQLQSAMSVQLLVVRYPQHFIVDLMRGLGGLMDTLAPTVTVGIAFEKSEGASERAELKITSINQEGFLERWNQLQISRGYYQFVVTTGMRISAVNGVEGDVHLLEEALHSGQATRLQIRRADIAAVAKKKLVNKLRSVRSLCSQGTAGLKEALGSAPPTEDPAVAADAAQPPEPPQSEEVLGQHTEAPQPEECPQPTEPSQVAN